MPLLPDAPPHLRKLEALSAGRALVNDDLLIVKSRRLYTNTMGVPFEALLPYGIMLVMFGITVRHPSPSCVLSTNGHNFRVRVSRA